MLVALSHGYPSPAGDGGWSMGGEVSLHRTLQVVQHPVTVLTKTQTAYSIDGIRVEPIRIADVLNVNADPRRLVAQLKRLGATVVLAQNELSFPAVRAAQILNIPSIVSVHTPPKYGTRIRKAIQSAKHRIYNTNTSASEWRLPGIVLHPPTPPLPAIYESEGDAYTLLSSLRNKGVEVVLELAERLPKQRFIIVRSPAETTHGIPDLEERAARLHNVELCPRVPPDQVYDRYLKQTRIILVPSLYETYGMSAIEAAGYGIPSVHVDTPHVREGIGDAAVLVPPLNTAATLAGIQQVEADYSDMSRLARLRAEYLAERQQTELEQFSDWIDRLARW